MTSYSLLVAVSDCELIYRYVIYAVVLK